MRLNRYIALSTGLSRRAADQLISEGRVEVNGQIAQPGYDIKPGDQVKLDAKVLMPAPKLTILLNKPVGYVVSRSGQGNRTIYDLLPKDYAHLKPVGRLDKDSSGLLILTNDGELANQLTHPRYSKQKLYEVELDKLLSATHQKMIVSGVTLDDGVSKLKLDGSGKNWTVTMSEGRNRQIRRTFSVLGYRVIKLNRLSFGAYKLANLQSGEWKLS